MQSFFRWLRFEWWYFRKPPWDTGVSPPELRDYIAAHPPGNALDLGCGTGVNVVTLARAGWRTCGVDVSRRAVALARRRLKQAQVRADLRVGDVTRLDSLPGWFDFILDIGCFHQLFPAERRAYCAGIRRLLRRGGDYLVYAHWKGAPDDSHGIDEVDLERFADFLRLLKRSDGWERDSYPSVWLEFCMESA
jgi:SAM-dependent methyltransferase